MDAAQGGDRRGSGDARQTRTVQLSASAHTLLHHLTGSL